MTQDAGRDVSPATKDGLRRVVRSRLRALPPAERVEADRRICGHLSSLAAELGPEFVLGYLALPDEVRLDGFLSSVVQGGSEVWLPRVRAGHLEAHRWRPGTPLSRDDEGVLAPSGDEMEEWPGGTGMFVVPGRGFDPLGRRLGRGGGYYDRLLASAVAGNPWVVGAAYECQVLEGIPHEAHDRDVEYLVTETGWRRVSHARNERPVPPRRSSRRTGQR